LEIRKVSSVEKRHEAALNKWLWNLFKNEVRPDPVKPRQIIHWQGTELFLPA